MKISDLEQAVLEREEVRIVVRAAVDTQIGEYKYERKAAANASVTEWLEQRIYPLLDGNAVVVIDGNGAIPHGRTKMETLRNSYTR